MAGTGRQTYAVSAFQLAAGAAFLGAAYDTLFLGHWYLTVRKVRATRSTGTVASQAFNPLLTAGALVP
jgi:hypothetical protein